MPRKTVSDSEFIALWQASESVEEVVEASGLKESTCRTRCSELCKAGVPLKQMPRSDSKAAAARDVASLIEQAKAALPEGAKVRVYRPRD